VYFNQIIASKSQLLARAVDVFSDEPATAASAIDLKILHAKINAAPH
jgi:hypothetical protein